MAIIDNTYDMNEDIDDLEEQSENAGAANFVAARDYMLNLLKGRGIAASLMGGYSLLMRGSPRITLDIDIGVRARIKDLDEKVKGDPRILYPRGPKENVVRTFVKTGAPHDHSSPVEQLVQVDLKIEGAGSTTGLNPTSEMVRVGNAEFRMYDIMTMMKLKLKSFDDRQSVQDMQDIEWLVQMHEAVISADKEKLDYDHKETFIEALIEAHGENDRTNRIKMVLGLVWPPEE